MKKVFFALTFLLAFSLAASAQYAEKVDTETLTVAASTADTSSWYVPDHFPTSPQDYHISYKFSTTSGTFDTITLNLYHFPEYSTSVSDWALQSSTVVTKDTTLNFTGQLIMPFFGDQIITDTTTKVVTVDRYVGAKER